MSEVGDTTMMRVSSTTAVSMILGISGVTFATSSALAESALPQLNPVSFSSQIFWLLVSFVILYVIISRVVLPRISQILQRRMRNIDADYSTARKYRREVEMLITEMEELLNRSRQESQKLLRNKYQALQADMTKRQNRIQQEIAVEVGEYEQKIADAKNDALGKMDDMASELIKKCVVMAGGSKPTKTEMKAALEGLKHKA
ncbi:MAG: hypothetical protein HRT36_04575 [Alphaproteobacteria bacterium]|nr:hypothetical protein [Alphaproteobacteria bacterium]